jgi:BASS family bile acid:Na+ symporter
MCERFSAAYRCDMTTAAIIPFAVNASLAVMALSVGLQTEPADARWLLRHPSLMLRSILSMSIVMPLAALYAAIGFDLPPAAKLAIVALAISPIPAFWPKKDMRLGGDASYAPGLLAMASLFSMVLVPLSVYTLGTLLETTVHVSSWTLAGVLAKDVLFPLSIGLVARHFAPLLSSRVARPIATLGLGVLCLAAIPILISAGPAVGLLLGNGSILAIMSVVIVGLAAGHLLGGPGVDNRSVLAFSTASRHPAVALAIAQATFPGNMMVSATVLLELIVVALVAQPYVSLVQRIVQLREPVRGLRAAANYGNMTRPGETRIRLLPDRRARR